MAFVVKETVNDTDGNSYTSLEYAEAYFVDRPNAKWTGSDAVKRAALIAATDYAAGRWGRSYTDDVYAALAVPDLLQRAAAEYAVRALQGPLIPDPVVGDNGLGQVLKRKKTGPLEKEWEVVGDASRPGVYRSYPSADILMAQLIKSASDRVYR